MSHPGVPPVSPPPGWAQQALAPTPPPPPRDGTRTVAIIALVVASVALLGQLLSMVVPFLFFGVFGLFGSGFEMDEGYVEESGGVTIGGGQVAADADGTVPASRLTSAVRDAMAGGDPFLPPPGEVTCDAVPRVARDASVLCRADVDGWYGIVRFTADDGSFEVLSVGAPG